MLQTLYEISLLKIASILHSDIYNHAYSIQNPFCFLPSPLVEDIIKKVSQSGIYTENELHYLLTSGRVENLCLTSIMQFPEELPRILETLSSSSENLRSITLHVWRCKRPHRDSEDALEKLLLNSNNLESLDTQVVFNLKLVRKMPKLRIIKIKFRLRNPLQDILDEKHEEHVQNHLIHTIESCKGDTNSNITIVQNCKELTVFQEDISPVMDMLYGLEFLNTTLTARYQLQKITMGSFNRAPSPTSVTIAAETCPFVNEIFFCTMCSSSFVPLEKFENLRSLQIMWASELIPGNFNCVLNNVLCAIGHHLQELSLSSFSYVSIGELAKSCPQLQFLELNNCYNVMLPAPPFTSLGSFQKLKHLSLSQFEDIPPIYEEDVIAFLISCSPLLETLRVTNALTMNDIVIEKTLKCSHLSKLKSVFLRHSRISFLLLRDFFETAKNLKHFYCLYNFSDLLLNTIALETLNSTRPCVDFHSDWTSKLHLHWWISSQVELLNK